MSAQNVSIDTVLPNGLTFIFQNTVLFKYNNTVHIIKRERAFLNFMKSREEWTLVKRWYSSKNNNAVLLKCCF